jgi:hypothetical protein
VWILFLPAALGAQNPLPSGNLYGTTLDEQGKTIAGVAVTLRGPGAAQAATTDLKGDFRFLYLPPAKYLLILERSGFEVVARQVDVTVGGNAVLTIALAVAGAAEEVAVTGTPVLDNRKIDTGATFERKELDTVPTTRDPWAILRQVPGVLVTNMNVNGSDSGAVNGFVGKGSHLDQNTYNLDGVSIGAYYFDFDSFQEIAAVTGGSDPSLATPGVALNLVTKRGTNALRGSGRALYFFPSSVDSSDQISSKGGWDYGLETGGPVWRDRLWLWGAGASIAVPGQTFFLEDGEPVRRENHLHYWNAKLNAQLAASNSLTLFFMDFNNEIDGRTRGSAVNHSQESTWHSTIPTSAYRAEDSHVVSEKLFASAYFSYLASDLTLLPEGGLEQQSDQDASNIWRNSYQYIGSRTHQSQAGVTASTFFDTGHVGHELKFGFGYRHAPFDSFSSWPGGGLIGFEGYAQAAITRDAHYAFETNYYDTHLTDTIRAGNLTLNLGLRFDYQQARNLPSSAPANPLFPKLLPAIQYSGDPGYPITWRLFQPRIGATYAVGQDRKTLFRASYSRFVNQLDGEVGYVNAVVPAYLYYAWNDTNGNHRVEPGEVDLSNFQGARNVDPANPGLPVSVNQIERGLRPPTTDEFIVAVEREFFSDLSASFAYTHRTYRNLVFLQPYAPTAGVTVDDYQRLGNASGSVAGADGFTLNFNEPYYGLTTCPSPCSGILINNRPDYSESYNGLELQVLKRLSHHWMLRASFAYNDWTKDVGPGAIFNPNNLVGGLNSSGAAVQGNANRFTGFLFINSRWQFNLSGLVQLPLGFVAAANLFAREGFAQPYYLQVFTYDVNGSRPNLQIGEVDAYRLPDVYQLDLHLEKSFQIGPVTITPAADCFNVANSHTVLQRDGFAGFWNHGADQPFSPNSGFNAVAERLSDRTFRAGVRVSF